MKKLFSLSVKALFIPVFLVLSACSSDGGGSSDRDENAEASYPAIESALQVYGQKPIFRPGFPEAVHILQT